MKRQLWILGIAAALMAASLTACGGNEESAKTVTVRETVAQPAPEETEPTPTEADPTEEAPIAGQIRVPNVVGKDHQLAQDTMQAAGLYNLSEEDATGQDRLLLFDRNWTVVSQSPRPGTLVDADITIILRSKKDGE